MAVVVEERLETATQSLLDEVEIRLPGGGGHDGGDFDGGDSGGGEGGGDPFGGGGEEPGQWALIPAIAVMVLLAAGLTGFGILLQVWVGSAMPTP